MLTSAARWAREHAPDHVQGMDNSKQSHTVNRVLYLHTLHARQEHEETLAGCRCQEKGSEGSMHYSSNVRESPKKGRPIVPPKRRTARLNRGTFRPSLLIQSATLLYSEGTIQTAQSFSKELEKGVYMRIRLFEGRRWCHGIDRYSRQCTAPMSLVRKFL
jgi:hypothetical protein